MSSPLRTLALAVGTLSLAALLPVVAGAGALAQTATPPSPGAQTATPATPGAQTATPAAPGVTVTLPTVNEIVVAGADEVLQGLVKVSINVQEGDPVSGVRPDELRLQVLELGYFRDARVEIITENNRNRLVITVQPNPAVGEVVFSGNAVVPTDALRAFLDQNLNIAPGTVVNTARLEESRDLIAQAYRQTGLPFAPRVSYEVGPAVDGKVRLTYTIDEAAPLTKIVVGGATLVPVAEIEAAFKPLTDKGTFDAGLYGAALQDVAGRYTRLGYRGSRVNPEGTELAEGTLTVAVVELKVGSLDASALGVDPATLSIKVGDFFNYDKLLADVQTLARGRDKQVQLSVEQLSADSVAVALRLEDAPAGPITGVNFEGNTVLTDAELTAALRQKVGDTYNATLAAQADYPAVAALYEARGHQLGGQPTFAFENGVYTMRVTELKLAGYELRWRGEHRTQDFVVLREFPEPGGLFSVEALRRGFSNLQRDGIVTLPSPPTLRPAPDRPDAVIVVIDIQDAQTGLFQPALGYSTIEGFSGSLSYSERNLFGIGHQATASFQAGQNDAGQVISGGLSYTIPWLYIDFLDFKRARTSVQFSVSSTVTPGNALAETAPPVGQSFPDDPNTPENEAEPRTRLYSIRTTGVRLALERPIGDLFSVGLSYDFQYQQNYLERAAGNPVYYVPDDAVAGALLASVGPPSATSFIQGRAQFSTKNSVEFPTGGVVVAPALGYGFGSQGDRGLSWVQPTLGARAYFGFGLDQNGNFGIGPGRNIALAARFNTGVIVGAAPTGRQFSIGGSGSVDDVYTVRGYGYGDLRGDVFYTGGLELRYDFGLRTAVTNGLIAIAFIDVGNAWGNGFRAERKLDDGTITRIGDGPVFGYGIGLQINIGIGSFQLPAIRFDYGFSPWSPTGRFYFRLGYVF